MNDLWKFKLGLDRGKAGKQGARVAASATTASASAAREPSPTSVVASDSNAAVPDASEPVWVRLAQGHLNLDIRLLSLKLLLNRVRSQFEVI